jgi:molecular chaperone DnaK (HSP70)
MAKIGIDFGAYSCYVSVAKDGGVETLLNDYGQRCTP